MELTSKFVTSADEYKIWCPLITIPCRRWINGELQMTFFTKKVDWDSPDVKAYWALKKEFGIWNLYRVYKNPGNRRLAWSSAEDVGVDFIKMMIRDKVIDVHSCDLVERRDKFVRGPKLVASVVWSIEYDGRSVLELLAAKPKMSFGYIEATIKREGGYIDEKSIIHRGTAESKIVEI